jgi:hypothetical protein
MIKNARKAIVGHINDTKIVNMYNAGCKKHQIVGVFLDCGITTTPEYVQGVIDTHDSNYKTKFLPNDAVSNAIATAQGDFYPDSVLA